MLIIIFGFLLCVTYIFFFLTLFLYEPRHEKTGLRGFQLGATQTELHKHRRWLKAGNSSVTVKLICAFVFAQVKIRLNSHDAAHISFLYTYIVTRYSFPKYF